MEYGVANKRGRPTFAEVREILDFANSNGIQYLDTAASYGESEEVLGIIDVTKWNVITKLLPYSTSEFSSPSKYVMASYEQSRRKLKLDSIYGLMVHNAKDLSDEFGLEICETLLELRAEGMVDKIGVSVYSDEDLSGWPKFFTPDIIQGPANVLDQRLVKSERLANLRNLGCEFHARSIFLQGLLLQTMTDRDPKFSPWQKQLELVVSAARELELGLAEFCLSFAKSFQTVDKIVFGVDGIKQLEELILAWKKSPELSKKYFQKVCSNDLNLIDPRNWK
jgi:aryl-alcohol dehydrogenase-like predicted oxidoreductase